MDDLKDYQVSMWMENGLIRRIHDKFISWRVPVSAVLAGAAALLVSANTTNLDCTLGTDGVGNSGAVASLYAQASRHPTMVRLRELGRFIEEGASKFGASDISDIDPELLALADVAIRRIDERQQLSL